MMILTFNHLVVQANRRRHAQALELSALENTTRKLKDFPDLVHLVEPYLEINIENRDFFTKQLKDFLSKARVADRLLINTFVLVKEGHDPLAVLQKLSEFMEVGYPFTEEFVKEFKLVGERLVSTFNALHHLKDNLKVSLKEKLCDVGFFMVTSVTEKFHSTLERKKEAIETLQEGILFAVDEFNCILDLLKKLENKFDSRIRAAIGLAPINNKEEEEEEAAAALKAVMLEIMHNGKSVEDLENQVDRHATELSKAISVLITPRELRLSVNSSATVHSLSFNNSLSKALMDNTRKLKDEISSNPDLVHFVNQHLQINIDNLHFFTTNRDFLRKTSEADRLLRKSVALFEEVGHDDPGAVLKKLRKFKEVGNPFTKEFTEEFELIGERLSSIVTTLRYLKEKLDQKLLSVKEWRVASNMAFITVSICFTVLSAVLSAVHASGVVFILSDVIPKLVTEPLKKGGDWVLDEFQRAREKEKEVIETLEKKTRFALDKFNCIRDLLEKLKIEINSSIFAAELAIEDQKAAPLKPIMVLIKHNAKSAEDSENKIAYHANELHTSITMLKIDIY